MTNIQTVSGAAAAANQSTKSTRAKATRTETLLNLLRSKRGATIEQLQQASGWQSHSVRGFLSGTVRKKLGLTLVAECGKDGLRRYRVEHSAVGE